MASETPRDSVFQRDGAFDAPDVGGQADVVVAGLKERLQPTRTSGSRPQKVTSVGSRAASS